MDLLGGYSSSDDDDDAVKRKQPKEAETSSETSTKQEDTAPLSMPNKKGKKMISMAAVLPRHIFDQLTQAQVKGAADDHDDDSEDDERSIRHAQTKGASGISTQQQQQRDPELSSLLSELGAAPTSKFIAGASSFVKKGATRGDGDGSVYQPLGSAFAFSTTTVERKSKDATATVRSIYDPKDKLDAATAIKVGSASSMTNEPHAAVADHRTPASPATSSAPKATLRSFRPAAAPRVSAAPTSTGFAGHSMDSSSPFTNQQQSRQGDGHDVPREELIGTHDGDGFTSSNIHGSNNNNPRKRSRKELERALRHGQLDTVETDISLEAANTNHYHATAASLSAAPPSEFGIRVAATGMYDPSAGGVVVGGAGHARGRGKNQINSIMAAAANLEEQRRQQYQRDGSGAASGKSYRANAKQKYGW